MSASAAARASPWFRLLPGLAAGGDTLDLDQVESLFQRLASAASGLPKALGVLPTDRTATAPPRC